MTWKKICFVVLIITGFVMSVTAAPIINPSSPDTIQDSIFNYLKSWLQGDAGETGLQGVNGTPGADNFTSVYYNASNFTAYANNTHFYNSSNVTSFSNWTVFENASVYNTTTDHGLLTNLTIDDHLQYANLSGRSGGQVLTGGTDANEDLILNGTSSATKTSSYVLLQPDGGTRGTTGTSGGFVGIGTFVPSTMLDVRGNSSLSSLLVLTLVNIAAPVAGVDGVGMSMLGTAASPTTLARLRSYWTFANTTNSYFVIENRKNNVIGESMRIHNTGNITIGSPLVNTSMLNVVGGSVRFSGYGIGAATFDAGGNISSVSDAKYKTVVTPYTKGVSSLPSPSSYKWNYASGLSTSETNIGFIAQDVQRFAPECVYSKQDVRYDTVLTKKATSPDEEDEYTSVAVPLGTYTLSYSQQCVIAITVNSIKEQQVTIEKQDIRIKALEKKVGL